jgi:hypothetical protein
MGPTFRLTWCLAKLARRLISTEPQRHPLPSPTLEEPWNIKNMLLNDIAYTITNKLLMQKKVQLFSWKIQVTQKAALELHNICIEIRYGAN